MTQMATIIGLGEVLWDVFPDGPRFGGAPANFACHAAQLGADARMVSAVGSDDLGRRAMETLRQRGVDTSCVAWSEYPTGAVHVQLDDAGNASYRFGMDTAWDHLAWSDDLVELASKTGALCFGTLGQRSDTARQTIRRFVAATPNSALRIFDINLRPPFYEPPTILESLELANILKLNDDELPVVASLCELSGSDSQVMQQLARRFDLQAVALTRGPDGAVLVRGDQVGEHPGIPTDVVDTVGAGDAFTASLAMGLLAGHDLNEINRDACSLAAFVCSQPGATPELPDEFQSTGRG